MKAELIAFINATHNNNLRNQERRYMTSLSCGYANGYVAVPPEHPAYGKDDLQLCDIINVHGGVTFSWPAVYPKMHEGRKINPDYVGKKNQVLENAEYLTEGIADVPDDWWIIGFDTCHFRDSLESCPREYVVAETQSLKAQLEKLWQKKQTK